jgi:VDE lipocalin domain
MIALTSYIIHVYIILPIVWRSLQAVYHKRYDICPLVKCLQPLTSCLQEVECRAWLDEVAACQDPQSVSRQTAMQTFAHLQHPDNPAYCQYQSFDSISHSSSPALAFVECIGKSHCLPPSDYSDTCATITTKEVVVPLDSTTILAKNLPGRWLKVYTTGWDLWPCQWTDFWPPSSTNPEHGTDHAAAAFGGTPVVDQNLDTSSSPPPLSTPPPPEPEEWMTAWPHDPNVWRMDLYWKHSATANLTFHMNNEMYLGETWDFSTTTTTNAPPPSATLKTRAVMWGTEAHENWYLLDYHSETRTTPPGTPKHQQCRRLGALDHGTVRIL